MTIRRYLHVGALVALVAASGASADDARTWTILRGPSSIDFTVDHLIFAKVSGSFRRFEGTVENFGDDPTTARAKVVIEISSLRTGNADRDRELQSAEFFDAQRFPHITFQSLRVERADDGRYSLVGALTIRGTEREVALDLDYLGETSTAAGQRREFNARGVVERSDFGLDWNDTWAERAMVGETVTLDLHIVLIEATA